MNQITPVKPSCEVIPDHVLAAVKSGPKLEDLEAIVLSPDGKLAVRSTVGIANPDLTDGEKVIRWAEECLVVPEGPKVGEALKFDVYQRLFILCVFDNPHGTSSAMLSVARRNGKTFIVAVILLSFIIGPMRKMNTSMCSAANAREQAAIAFDLMKMMLDLSPKCVAGVHYSYTESYKTITGLRSNVRYRAISAEAKTGHGKAYKIILLDEAGQIEAESNRFTDMLETSMSNYDDALFLLISTQAESDASYFSQQLDNAVVQQDPTLVSHVYSADKGDDLQDKKVWQKANPGLGIFVSEKKMAQKAAEAIALPSKANGIMNLNYNMRVSQQAMLLSPEAWKDNQRPTNEISRSSSPIDIGLDLSIRSDLTAAVACWRDENGDINVETHAFAPLEGVKQRGIRDKAPYERWADEGYLQLTPDKVVDYEWVAAYLAREFEGCDVRSIQLDRYRIELFEQAAKKTDFYGMVPATNEEKTEGWLGVGQGFISMGIRIDAFEQEVMGGKLRTGPHPLLNLAASHTIVGTDPAGNRKALKNMTTQRIDPIVAAIMGVFPNSDGQVEANEVDVTAMIG